MNFSIRSQNVLSGCFSDAILTRVVLALLDYLPAESIYDLIPFWSLVYVDERFNDDKRSPMSYWAGTTPIFNLNAIVKNSPALRTVSLSSKGDELFCISVMKSEYPGLMYKFVLLITRSLLAELILVSLATSQDVSCWTATSSPPILLFWRGHSLSTYFFKLFRNGWSFLTDHSTLNGLSDLILISCSIDLTRNYSSKPSFYVKL